MRYVLMGVVALVLVGGLLVLLARNAERRAHTPRKGRAGRGAVETGAVDGGVYSASGFESGGGCDSGGGDGGGCD